MVMLRELNIWKVNGKWLLMCVSFHALCKFLFLLMHTCMITPQWNY